MWGIQFQKIIYFLYFRYRKRYLEEITKSIFMENPVVFYTTNQRYQAEVLKAKLEENDISAYIIDKKDSAYVVIGEVELYVEAKNIEKAKALIDTE